MTYFTKSLSIKGEISPVIAPFSANHIFWAPKCKLRGRCSKVSVKGTSQTNGGQRTISTESKSSAALLIVDAKTTASASVVFIFQLPITKGLRILLLY